MNNKKQLSFDCTLHKTPFNNIVDFKEDSWKEVCILLFYLIIGKKVRITLFHTVSLRLKKTKCSAGTCLIINSK